MENFTQQRLVLIETNDSVSVRKKKTSSHSLMEFIFRLLRKESRETSPLPSRKQRKKMSTDGGSRGRYGQLTQQQQSLTDNTTVFFLPGVDVKVGF